MLESSTLMRIERNNFEKQYHGSLQSYKTSTRRNKPKKIQCSARKWNIRIKEERDEWIFEIVEVTKLLKYLTSS